MFINRSISSQKKSPVQSHSFCPKSIHIRKVTLAPNPRRLLPHSQLRGFANVLLSTWNILLFCNPTPKSLPLRAPGTPIKPPLTPQLPQYLFLWVTTALKANMVTISNGYGHLGCYVEKDSETETVPRISRKECHTELECRHEVQEVGAMSSLARGCGACMLVWCACVLLPLKPGTQSHTLYSCPL